MSTIQDKISDAVKTGKLQQSTSDNIQFILGQSNETWVSTSIEELVEGAQWAELNDRFYKTLSFGTGGLRGRTIGKVVTKVEQGKGGVNGRPERSAVGTNSMNDFNVSRATQGLINYIIKQFPNETPKIVISHDSRHFSRQFAELIADIAAQMGGIAYLFAEERSTPELSFAVRFLKAHTGVMITASHNPPHDNGFKAYFQDGGQLVEPHATSVIKEVLAIKSGKVEKPAAKKGEVVILGKEVDTAYIDALKTLVLDPSLIKSQSSSLKIVYTPLHGTGIKIIPQILDAFQFSYSLQKEQSILDGRFPTVKSPNPEYPEALALGVEQAKKEGADLVFATDPDADRMGVAVKNGKGEFEMITGNQIGSLIAAYRLEKMFAQGILNSSNASHATIIKTFVTTDLQKAIAGHYGVKCVETLTGFKYIGEKLKDYEELAGGRGSVSPEQWRSCLLEKSTFFVFGGEESYGYSGGDYVRDKDANAAVLMMAEVAAYAKSRKLTLVDYLEEIYLKFGLYGEKLGTLTFEGAEGAAKIKKLLESYRTNSPKDWNGRKVEGFQNFATDKFKDVDGKDIPSELMLMFHLSEGYRVVVRGSGTEPKIKFYFLGRADVPSKDAFANSKKALKDSLESLWAYTQEDANKRAA